MGRGPSDNQWQLAELAYIKGPFEINRAIELTGATENNTYRMLKGCENHGLLICDEFEDPHGITKKYWYTHINPEPFLYPCGEFHPDPIQASHCCWNQQSYPYCGLCGTTYPVQDMASRCWC